jgi:hypothetical protein
MPRIEGKIVGRFFALQSFRRMEVRPLPIPHYILSSSHIRMEFRTAKLQGAPQVRPHTISGAFLFLKRILSPTFARFLAFFYPGLLLWENLQHLRLCKETSRPGWFL